MRPINAGKIIKVLETNGFVLSRQKGSHMIWKNPESGIIVPIPLHGKSKPIPIGTFLAIVKQSKIPKEKFK
ncbi:type II toxin-antitoxin system HicA family toxin [Patescibacteria group bacterium]|nr:type II toxin-antitoxin system HicA family toxin [Patescibacteria group bacterium]MBU4000278.1 type II toxin-antitoxin system HicA family toxin [Patescibacteria group bacterium]MBU4056563.1 type II toxin-antitoxin system HicA family toxin [Patescibacteria group bacterium]MBU4368418.1 type II toxin-antitoxin system HicA family toxin [Patescibacteria group bacterium]